MFALAVVSALAAGSAAEAQGDPRIAQAAPATTGAARGPSDAGGRGLITWELATGMFINPTSGTLARHELTTQYCLRVLHAGDDTVVRHGAIAGFGLTEWLELGVAGLLSDLAGDQKDTAVGGPTARLRLVEDRGAWPELGVGGILLLGDEALERHTAYVAASKGIRISQAGLLRSARVHAGFRQTWVEVGEDDSVGYVGGEVELPKHVFVVTEVSSKPGDATKIPWAAGLQVRHPEGFGFTLALAQPGALRSPAVYVGVGINF